MPKIGVRLLASFESAAEFLADAQSLEAAGAGLLLLDEGGDLDREMLLAAIAAVTTGVSLHHAEAGETLRRLAGDRLLTELDGWRDVPFPVDRAAWRATLVKEASSAGVIVAMDPRLLDLLRNPDVEDDRSTDRELAQG